MRHIPLRMVPLPRLALAALTVLTASAHAGTYTNDFSSDPFSAALPANQRLTIFSNQGAASPDRPSWVSTNGNPDGYLKLTDAIGSIRSTIVFPDFEPGFPVAGFHFEMDCRLGGGGAAPADGFSINFARSTDPVITTGTPYAGANTEGHTEADRHEEGTATGIGIGFDAYNSGGTDVIGISVRVNNTIVTQVAAPTLNGSVTDATSLQTGPLVAGTPAERVAALGWGRFVANLDPISGKLDVYWKGTKVIDQLETGFAPSPGRLVFGARTGGQNQVHHFDNIVLNTFPVEKAAVTSARVGHDGYFFEITDYSTTSIVTTTDIDFFALDGVEVTPTVTKTGNVTKVHYLPPTPLAAHATVPFVIQAHDQNGNPVDQTGSLITPVLPQTFFITDTPTLNQWNVRQLRGGTVNGAPPINSALAIATTPPGTVTNVTAPYFNYSDDASFGARGFFKRDTLIPANVTGNEDNIVTLGKTKIQITQPGDYTFWVQSDDGFALRVNGQTFTKVAGNGLIDPSDASTIAFFNGTGNSNTRGVVNLAAGEYTLEFLWFEGTSDSYCEVAWSAGDNAADTTTGRWSLVGGLNDTPHFPAAPLAAPATVPNAWAVRNYHNGGTVASLRAAFTFIASPPGAAIATNANTPVVNFRDPQNAGADGIFRNNVPFPMEATVPGVDDNQFVTIARYDFVAATAGDYSFGITSDDGIAFRMLGGPYLINGAGPTNLNSGNDPLDSTAFLNSGAHAETSFGVYRIAAPGTYTIEVVQVEQTGGASMEVVWTQGNFTTINSTSSWKLLGNPADPSVPIAPPILPVNLFDSLPLATASNWSARFYYPPTAVASLTAAITAMQNAATPFHSGMTPALNYRNFVPVGQTEGTWISGIFYATSATAAYQTPAETQFIGAAGLVDNMAALATSRIVIPTTGLYTFGVISDDSFALRVVNAPTGFIKVNGNGTIDSAQTNTIYRLTGTADTRAVINLPAGQYDLEFAYYEGTGNAHFEVFAVAGDVTNVADTTNWRIVGGTGGLALVAQPSDVTPVIGTIGFNAGTGAFNFSWNSSQSATYKIQYSANLTTWFDLEAAYPGQAGPTTTYSGNVSALTQIPSTTKVFFRLSQN